MSESVSGTEVRQWHIFGRVQGVAFRWFTRQEAQRLGLEGWVRNREDGSVEVQVRGAASKVAQLEARVRRGPAMAKVQRLDEEALDSATPLGPGFEIRY